MTNKNMQRRNLMKGLAAAIVVPTIIPSSALGKGNTPPPSERVTLGHIGVGGRGSGVMGVFLNISKAQIVAVSDCYQSRCDRAADRVNKHYAKLRPDAQGNGCAAYQDFQELLARDDIDGVVIATPDHWHVPLAICAIESGKDVYVEKPLGTAMTWAWRLRELVNRRSAVFQYGTQQRSARNFRYACELVRNGYIGEIKRIEAGCPGMRPTRNIQKFTSHHKNTKPVDVPADLDYERWLGPATWSPYTKSRTTSYGSYFCYDNALGFIAGWGAHPLDIAQWGMNADNTAPIHYAGIGAIPTDGLFDSIAEWDVHCRYANGVSMRFMDEIAAQPIVSKYRRFSNHGTTFFGSEGWVSVDRGGIYAHDINLLRTKLRSSDERLCVSQSQFGNFVDGIQSRQPTINPVESAVNSDLISHLSDISIRLNRKVHWDPKKEKILNDPQATRMLHRGLRAPWML